MAFKCDNCFKKCVISKFTILDCLGFFLGKRLIFIVVIIYKVMLNENDVFLSLSGNDPTKRGVEYYN